MLGKIQKWSQWEKKAVTTFSKTSSELSQGPDENRQFWLWGVPCGSYSYCINHMFSDSVKNQQSQSLSSSQWYTYLPESFHSKFSDRRWSQTVQLRPDCRCTIPTKQRGSIVKVHGQLFLRFVWISLRSRNYITVKELN